MIKQTAAVMLCAAVGALGVAPAAAPAKKPSKAQQAKAKKKKQAAAKRKKAAAKKTTSTGPASAPAPATSTQTAPAGFSGPGRVFGKVTVGPNTFEVDATRPRGAAETTTGTFGPFVADGNLAQLDGMNVGPLHLEGRVTCLNVQGSRAALFYPFDKADPAALTGVAGIMIFVNDGGPGKADSASYLPLPVTSVTGCAPMGADQASSPVDTGDITIVPG